MKHVLARTRSEDPTQESLREHKSQWNKAVSEFIDRTRDRKLTPRLIALKKILNGHPVPEFGISEKGSIKEPLPDIAAKLLDALSSEYQTVAQEFSQLANSAGGLIQEQSSYSQNRRQPLTPEQRQQMQQERMQQMQQIQTAAQSNVLVKEAANPFTRLWTYISTPFMFGDKDRFIRKNMLQAAADIEQMLLEIGNEVLKREENSIPSAVIMTKNLINLFSTGVQIPLLELNKEKESEVTKSETNYIERKTVPLNEETFALFLKSDEFKTLEDYKKKFPEVIGIVIGKKKDGTWEAILPETRGFAREEKAEEKDNPTSELTDQVTRVDSPQDLSADPEAINLDGDNNPEVFEHIAAWQQDFNEKQNSLHGWVTGVYNVAKSEGRLQQPVVETLDNAFSDIERISVDLQAAINTHEDPRTIYNYYKQFIYLYNNIISIAARLQSLSSQDSEIMVKLAQSKMGWWLRRQWVSLLRGRDRQARLLVDRNIVEAEKVLNKLMDMLQERKAPIDELTKITISFAVQINEVIKSMLILADIHNNEQALKQYQARSKGKRVMVNKIDVTMLTSLKRMTGQLLELKTFVQQQKEKEEKERGEV